MRWIRWFDEIRLEDVPSVGGKNASLGEMVQNLASLGIRVPGGFALTAEAYRAFLGSAGLDEPIRQILRGLRKEDVEDLTRRSERIREIVVAAAIPPDMRGELAQAYAELSARHGLDAVDVAVRSSATAEDLPTASFAGQQETFLNVRGAAFLCEAVKKAFASLFTPRAISYREDMGFDHFKVALSVGVQKMVRSDLASAGVVFTLDTESGHRGMVLVTSSYGLGENVVQGKVVPDQFYVHKATLAEGFRPLVWKKLGSKELTLVYDESGHRQVKNVPVPRDRRDQLSLQDEEVLELARLAVRIEQHYARRRGAESPMDIEWAKDGQTGEIYVVQARPETVHAARRGAHLEIYRLGRRGKPLVEGLAVGDRVGVGRARVIREVRELESFRPGEVLVSMSTDPDWEPVMKIAAGIVTERGGRTSHAAIVARELGIPAVVGAEGALRSIAGGDEITVSCAEGSTGFVYRGRLPFEIEEVDPMTLGRPRTRVMLNVGQPEQALQLAQLPSDGVGLARMEFIFSGWVKVHPLALTRFDALPADARRAVQALTRGYVDKREYFVDRLSQGIGLLAAAFWPRPVILRFSDFKTNEYARLLGGEAFEPREENPMLGWRGASRYDHPGYREGFLLEVAAVKRVRELFGLKNLKVMVPFCRTPEEGRRVLRAMEEGGLRRGQDGLEVYVMAEIPSNILLASDFAEIFDGFSIGSNDLTQLTLGVDRDSDRVAPLFDERSPAVLQLCALLLRVAHERGRPVGICGQAPSDYLDFATFLVERGIDSISLNPDSLVRTVVRLLEVERAMDGKRGPLAAPGPEPGR